MRTFPKSALLLFCLGFGLTGCTAVKPAAKRFDAANFNCPEFFPILPWDPLHGWDGQATEAQTNGLSSIADCHFNMAGFVLLQDLRQCERLGLGAIVLTSDTACTNFPYYCEWRKLSDAEIERRVRDQIAAAGASKAVVGYFITDEPGATDFPALAKAVAAVKKYAPGKLAYINLFPDYALPGTDPKSQLGTATYTEYLERFVNEVHPQVLSYDNYMVKYSQDLKDPGVAASYFNNLLEIRRVAEKYGLPCLNIVSANQLTPQSTVPSPENLLVQAYTTLAAGYRGVTWYTYYGRGYQYAPIDGAGERTLNWAWLKEVNRQVAALTPVMSRLRSTGVFFSSPAPAAALPVLPGAWVSAVTAAAPVMLGEFEDSQGKPYVMVVNLSLQSSTTVALKMKSAQQSLRLVSAMDGSVHPMDPKVALWLTAGQGVLLAVDH